ncbi:MAG: hypothetical protein RLZZ387_5626 [Chloroflexota bacterium]
MDLLQNPIALAVIVIVLVVAVAALVLIRRRRAGADDAPPPEIGDAIDYTSLPYEEPTTLGDRFRNASPAVKALAVLIPLVVIGVLASLALTLFQPGSETADAPTAGPPPTISGVTAEVAGQGKIVVRADTTLADGAAVTATMKQGEQDFPWFNPDSAVATAESGRVTMTLDRIEGAPTPQQDEQYSVTLVSTLADGTVLTSEPATVTVLPNFAGDFYQAAVAAPTAAPTAEPTPQATAEPAATPEPAEPTPEVAATQALTATVRNGGNIRQQPNTSGEVLGQVSAGEVVELLALSPDGQWYLLRSAEAEGWVSGTLLTVTEAAAQLPRQAPTNGPTAQVFNGGNVRAAPNLRGEVLDQINAGETVQLLARTEDGTWYQITNERRITGWVSVTLLEVALEDRRSLPVSNASVPTPLPATLEALPAPATPAPVTPEAAPPSTGLTALVFNGGNVRAAPNLQGNVLDQINAGETVQLLAKTTDGNWYQITNVRGVTGWVNRTLLTVDPEVARRVPVSE